MSKVIITTDSTADLSQAMLDQYQIKTVPLYVRFEEEFYKDGVDITTPELYKKVSELGYLPKTAAVSPGDFVDFFEPFLKEGYKIVHISIGASISGTYQSALLAKDLLETEDIFIINSDNLSSGIALLVLKATTFRDQGLDAKEIYEKTLALVPLVRSQFGIKTLDYLHKGGRASGLSALIGGVLKVRPIIQVRDGKLDVYKKPMGKMSRGLDIMLTDFFNEVDKDNIDLDFVMITHSLASSSYDYMQGKVLEKIQPKNLIESHAGCVISSHCGEGTIGILYIVKS